jgi:hypothetical protein
MITFNTINILLNITNAIFYKYFIFNLSVMWRYRNIQDIIILKIFRGFVKYQRETAPYRPAEKRVKDWDEIYNFPHVRQGLRVQAARCMECGVPFCQSSHGCPLGNIIPKWNDLVFNNNWREAINQLLQTNNFPGITVTICTCYRVVRCSIFLQSLRGACVLHRARVPACWVSVNRLSPSKISSVQSLITRSSKAGSFLSHH